MQGVQIGALVSVGVTHSSCHKLSEYKVPVDGPCWSASSENHGRGPADFVGALVDGVVHLWLLGRLDSTTQSFAVIQLEFDNEHHQPPQNE